MENMGNEALPFWRTKTFSISISAAAALLAGLLLVMLVSAIKEYRYIGAVPGGNTISVSGEGEVFAVPDIATFSFSVVEERDTVAEAQDRAAETISAAIDYLEDNGIEEEDIKTTAYNVFPQYDYLQRPCTEFSCPPGERQFRGFEVRQTITVKVRDTEQAGELLSGVGEIGVDSISGLSFTIEDQDVLLEEARAQAIADARAKAKVLAGELNVSLGRVVNFNESGGPGIYRSYGFGGDAAIVETAAITPDIPTGENRITSFVTVIYEIR